MKKGFKEVVSRAENGVIDRPAGSVSLVWLAILGVLFYLASIFVALAAEPVIPSTDGRAITSVSTFSSSKPRQSWFHWIFHKPTWSEVLEQCESPRDVCNIVSRFVSYRTEEVDRWASAADTWTDGRGDCEDFAICVEDLCHQLGFNATVNLYFPSGLRGDGHAVVVGNWNGQMWMSSNGSFELVRSLDDVKESVAELLGCRKDEMWGTVMAHADVERRIGKSLARNVASPQY